MQRIEKGGMADWVSSASQNEKENTEKEAKLDIFTKESTPKPKRRGIILILASPHPYPMSLYRLLLMAQMRDVPHGLRDLETWSLLGGTVPKGLGGWWPWRKYITEGNFKSL